MGNQVEYEVKSINKINSNIMTFAKQAMYYTNIQYFIDIAVAPRAGAWIETSNSRKVFIAFWSHPVRVRGLKQLITVTYLNRTVSHPVRVRGLKPSAYGQDQAGHLVAPRAGAWIET